MGSCGVSFERFLWAFEIRQARLSAKNHFYKARQTATAFSLAHALHKRFFARNTAPLFFLTENSGFGVNFRFFSGIFYEFLHKFSPKFVIASGDEVEAWQSKKRTLCV